MSTSGQKFVARNRAPRVQIEYDVELYGAEKKVQLPFVMGVMSDLSGKSEAPLPSVADRKFLEIDADNFDERMRALRPRATFTVPNTLSGDGNLSIDLSFESMKDFTPAAVAKKVEPLRKLLEARTHLSHLITYMDGKTRAEELIAKLIADPQALSAILASSGDAPASSNDQEKVLESLKQMPSTISKAKEEGDTTFAALDSLREQTVSDKQEMPDETLTAFESLLSTSAVPSTEEEGDSTQAALSALRSLEIETEDDGHDLNSALSSLLASSDEEESDHNVYSDDDVFDTDESVSDLQEDEDALDLASLLADGPDDLDDDAAFDDGSLSPDVTEPEEEELDLDALLDDQSDGDTDLSEELVGLLIGEDEGEKENEEPILAEPFGLLSLEQPQENQNRHSKFRIAILGDFTGRANRGDLATGDDLANRKPIKLDVDNLDTIIARFATTLVLPLGQDGAGIEVKLNGLDDLHPDKLYENVSIFEELSSLRQRVATGAISPTSYLSDLAAEPIDIEHLPRNRAKGSAVPANCKLSDFQSLIGNRESIAAVATPAQDLISRVVKPYVTAAPDPDQQGWLEAIDSALSGVMRAILHHPDFQAVESTWRSLDLLARRIETGASLEIILYDVSAEEWAADLSAQDELSESGLFRMLAEEPRLDEEQGALSAVFGLYSLEETPPHADLLARMAKISAWMNAPFIAAISPKFLEIPKQDRHPVTARKWDAMRQLPEASYVGLVSPRFLLRLPYGRKTEPVEPFDFEEFNLRSGLKGMLWANPVILSAILMAKTVSSMGKSMELGKIMSLDDMPVHTMNDQYGDQIALPCTERLLNTRTMADVVTRGFIPLLSIKGRNEVRQGSFQALSGTMLAGPWATIKAPVGADHDTTISFAAAPVQSDNEAGIETDALATDLPDISDEDLGSDFDLDLSTDDSDDDALSGLDSDDDDMDLDSLLASFDDDTSGTTSSESDDEDLDTDLAALLENL
nr:type VI secretion system contractile sheath small subunit [uncultured Cohaesibacter sp.]